MLAMMANSVRPLGKTSLSRDLNVVWERPCEVWGKTVSGRGNRKDTSPEVGISLIGEKTRMALVQ